MTNSRAIKAKQPCWACLSFCLSFCLSVREHKLAWRQSCKWDAAESCSWRQGCMWNAAESGTWAARLYAGMRPSPGGSMGGKAVCGMQPSPLPFLSFCLFCLLLSICLSDREHIEVESVAKQITDSQQPRRQW